jgi:hypothetical protein
MPLQVWRNINKIAVYVPGAARKRLNFRTEVTENATLQEYQRTIAAKVTPIVQQRFRLYHDCCPALIFTKGLYDLFTSDHVYRSRAEDEG